MWTAHLGAHKFIPTSMFAHSWSHIVDIPLLVARICSKFVDAKHIGWIPGAKSWSSIFKPSPASPRAPSSAFLSPTPWPSIIFTVAISVTISTAHHHDNHTPPWPSHDQVHDHHNHNHRHRYSNHPHYCQHSHESNISKSSSKIKFKCRFWKGSPRMKNAHNGIWITSTLIYKGNPHSSKKRRPDFHIQICFEHTPTWRKYASVQNSWEATSINIILINIFHHHPYEYHRYHDHRHSIKGPSLCMHCDFIHSRMWTSIMHDCGPGLNM